MKRKVHLMEVHACDTIDTPYEQGCIVVSDPDKDGNFNAVDSDGVLCQFNTAMVIHVDVANVA